MGKGKRVRAARAGQKEALKAQQAKKAKRNKITGIVLASVAAVLVVCIAVGAIYNAVYSAAYRRGDVQRSTVVMQTAHHSIDAAMMSYYFYTNYNSFVNNNSSYISSLGLDTSKSLKKQDCALQTGSTWFDYFLDQTKTSVKELLYLAEKASLDEMKLDDDDQETINKAVENLATYAKNNSMETEEFLSAVFGTGVKEKDVRRCMELSTLADKYLDQYQDSLDYSAEDIAKYYDEHINEYRMVDYYTYSVTAEDTQESDTYPAAKKDAEALAACKDVASFEAWVHAYATAHSSAEAAEDKALDGDSAVESMKVTGATYQEDDSALVWLFETAKVGETHLIDNESGTYTVYLLTKAPYRDESATRSIRDIVLTTANYESVDAAVTKANELKEEMEKAGLTEETFKKYAADYSEDTQTASHAGLCENYKQSTFDGYIGTWAFSSARKAGDFEVVTIDDGCALCYYVGEGIAAWQSDCVSAMKSADYDKAYASWQEEIELTENEKGYSKIPAKA